jgi:ElaB/YqjD/DUF883 family membrane-anchored ribosome-binding protein
MINPNGDDFTKNNPLPGSMKPSDEPVLPASQTRYQEASDRFSAAAGETWRQTRERASTAREKTEFFLRENPVPTVIGALAIGLAIGLAIRYSSESAERETKVKSPFGDVNLGVLSLPFLWPFFKTMQRRYEDSAEVVKDRVSDGVQRLRKVDVDDYVKPLRKKWRSWTN